MNVFHRPRTFARRYQRVAEFAGIQADSTHLLAVGQNRFAILVVFFGQKLTFGELMLMCQIFVDGFRQFDFAIQDVRVICILQYNLSHLHFLLAQFQNISFLNEVCFLGKRSYHQPQNFLKHEGIALHEYGMNLIEVGLIDHSK